MRGSEVNEKQKNILSLVGIIAVLGILFYLNTQRQKDSNEVLSSDWVVVHENATELVNGSDLVGRGTVVHSELELREDMVFTIQTIEIQELYLVTEEEGAVIASSQDLVDGKLTIELLQTGGTVGEVTTPPFKEAPLLELNKEYVFFLEKTEEGHYLPSGSFQGIAEIENGTLRFVDEVVPVVSDLEGTSLDSLNHTINKLPNLHLNKIVNTEKQDLTTFVDGIE